MQCSRPAAGIPSKPARVSGFSLSLLARKQAQEREGVREFSNHSLYGALYILARHCCKNGVSSSVSTIHPAMRARCSKSHSCPALTFLHRSTHIAASTQCSSAARYGTVRCGAVSVQDQARTRTSHTEFHDPGFIPTAYMTSLNVRSTFTARRIQVR